MAASILTMKQEEYFNSPDANDENVAILADAFTNPHTIRIFKHLFFYGNEKNTREEIKSECDLSDDELDAALEAFLDWRFAEWKDDHSLIYSSHGMNWVITLVGMTILAPSKSNPTHAQSVVLAGDNSCNLQLLLCQDLIPKTVFLHTTWN